MYWQDTALGVHQGTALRMRQDHFIVCLTCLDSLSFKASSKINKKDKYLDVQFFFFFFFFLHIYICNKKFSIAGTNFTVGQALTKLYAIPLSIIAMLGNSQSVNPFTHCAKNGQS